MLSETALFIIATLLQLATYAVLLRFILQAVRADYTNPLCQGIVRITDPVLRPLRAVIPGFGGLDLAALVAGVLLQMLKIAAGALLSGTALVFSAVMLVSLFALATTALLMTVLDLYFWSLIIVVVLSWIAPTSYHPAAMLLREMTEPLLRPVRNLLPPIGGLDFSVLVVMMVIIILRDILLPGLLPGV